MTQESAFQKKETAAAVLVAPSLTSRPEQARNIVERLTRLQNITAALASAPSKIAIGKVIVEEVVPTLDAEIGVVAVLEPDGKTLTNVQFQGVSRETQQAWISYSIESPVPVAEAALKATPIIVSTRAERNVRYPILASVHGVDHGAGVVAFPMILEDKVVGSIGFCFKQDRSFDEFDLTFLKTVAQQCATAVARINDLAARLAAEESSKKVAEQLTTLVEASSNLVSAPDSEAFFASTLDVCKTLIAADAYAIWLHVPETKQWRIATACGLSDGYKQLSLASIADSEPILNQPLTISDPDSLPYLDGHRHLRVKEGIRSLLVIPLKIEGKNAGTLVYYYRKRREFRPEDVRVGTGIGNLVAACLTNTRVHERELVLRKHAEDAHRRASFIAELSQSLSKSLDANETLTLLAKRVVPFVADCCSIYLSGKDDAILLAAVTHKDPIKEQILCEFAANYSPEDNPESLIRAVLKSGAERLIERVPESAKLSNDKVPPNIIELVNVRSIMVVPMAARGNVLGAITFISSTDARVYGARDLEFAKEIAQHAAWLIDNARLYANVVEADRRKDRFIAMLGHELRNPLAPIRNAAHILEHSDEFTASCVRARDIIARQVRHMTHLVDDLLDVSRIAMGKVSLQKEQILINGLIQTVLEDHRAAIESSNLSLYMNITSEELMVLGDQTRLAQVFTNLIHNAMKFTQKGGEIHVGLSCEAEFARITVRDTGVGMTRKTLDRLFDAFSQADETLDRTKGGLGLGLVLAKGLTELHGGKVSAKSGGLGEGSEFQVDLPLIKSKQIAKSKVEMKIRTEWRKQRILIVEDNRDAAESMRMILESSGNEVLLAYDGAAGVVSAEKFRPEIVICDIGLPKMNGYEVARTLKEKGVETDLLVALTGYGQDNDRELATASGFDVHLTKPVDPDNLIELVSRRR